MLHRNIYVFAIDIDMPPGARSEAQDRAESVMDTLVDVARFVGHAGHMRVNPADVAQDERLAAAINSDELEAAIENI